MELTQIYSVILPEDVKAVAIDSIMKENPNCTLKDFEKLGIFTGDSFEGKAAYALDAAPNLNSTPAIPVPVQLAQFWLADFIKNMTRPRTLDKVIGRTTAGTWETEQIVATFLERTGQPALYGDFTKAPLTSWNANFETRDNIRIEIGVMVGKLEELRSAQMRLNSASLKREAASEAMEIFLNEVGWFGYSGGGKKIYGLLTDPSLTLNTSLVSDWANSSVSWDTMVAEINAVVGAQVSSLNGHYDPKADAATLALPPKKMNALARINTYGISGFDYLAKAYPKLRLVTCPELYKATSSGGTDYDIVVFIVDRPNGQKTVDQLLTSNVRLVGSQPMAKGWYEVYSASTAGALVRIPLGMSLYRVATT